MTSSCEVSLIIPAYNEEELLERCVLEAKRAIISQQIADDFETIIAEDGGTDGTSSVARMLSRQDPTIKHLHNGKRLGRGEALRRAFRVAEGDVLVYIDADLSTDLRHLKDLVKAMKDGADITTGSRLLKGSIVRRPLIRELTSRIYNLVVKLILGSPISDHQCGFKAFKRASIQDVVEEVQDKHWFWDTELIVRALRRGYTVAEIPVRWTYSGRSKVRLLTDIVHMGTSVLRLWRQLRYEKVQNAAWV